MKKYVAYRKNRANLDGVKYWTGGFSEAGDPSGTVYIQNAFKFSSAGSGYLFAGSFGDEQGINGPLDYWKIGPA